MRSYKVEAIVLKRMNLGEADKILTVYTKNQGKLKALAKGVRKMSSRKGGNVEQFNHVFLFLAKGKNLDIITEVELIDGFYRWRNNLIMVGVAYYLAEVVDQLTPEGQRNAKVFFLLKNALGRIDQGNLKRLVREFEEGLLDELGFGVPSNLRKNSGSLSVYIEELIEKSIKSKQVLRKIKHGYSA